MHACLYVCVCFISHKRVTLKFSVCTRFVCIEVEDDLYHRFNDKCKFSKPDVKFLGQVIDKNGISPDPDKTQIIMKLDQPWNATEVRQYLKPIQ